MHFCNIYQKIKRSSSHTAIGTFTALLIQFVGLGYAQAVDLDPGSMQAPAQTEITDRFGVDMISGSKGYGGMQVSIGSQDSGIASIPGTRRYNYDNHTATITKLVITSATSTNKSVPNYVIGLSSGTYYKVDALGFSEIFSSGYSNAKGTGGSLSCSGSECSYTTRYGDIVTFDTTLSNNYESENTGSSESNYGLVSSITKTDGEQLTYYYQTNSSYSENGSPYDMPSAVVSSLGWILKYSFESSTEDSEGWILASRSIRAVNQSVEYCSPTGNNCDSLSSDWPVALMDVEVYDTMTNDGSSYTNRNRSYVTNPGDSSSDEHYMVYGRYAGDQYQNYTTPEGLDYTVLIGGYQYNSYYHQWEEGADPLHMVKELEYKGQTYTYDFSSASGYTGPDGTYEVDEIYDRLLSYTDNEGRTTSYSYDASFPLKISRIDYPAGHYTTYTYDTRGNITSINRYPAGGGTALSDTATYWTCNTSTQTYCNKPKTVTNADGAVTSYTYHATTGFVKTITKPTVTVTGGASVTPIVTYNYSQYTPKVLNSSGNLISNSAVWRLANIKRCMTKTGTSCSGTSDELVTEFGYGTYNLQKTSETVRTGNSSISLTTTFQYDDYGNVSYKSGPHSKDEYYYFYDLKQRLIGEIGPNPDGEGRVGTYTTYTNDGQEDTVIQGVVTNTTLATLKAMTWLSKIYTEYDTTTGLPKLISKLGQDTAPLYIAMSYYDDFRLKCKATRVSGNNSKSACYVYSDSLFGEDRVSYYEYDDTGALLSVTDGYDTSEERVTKETSYNSYGQVEWLKDGNGNITTYEYDDYGRPEKTIFAKASNGAVANSSDYIKKTYDGTQVKTLRLRNGNTITFNYDAWGRVTSKTGAVKETFVYDNFDNVWTHGNTTSGITATSSNSTYNALGWKLTEKVAGRTVTYGYDDYGRRNRLTWPDSFYVTYDYGSSLNLQSIKENGSTTLVSFAYDSMGRRASMTRANGVVTEYSYDDWSRLENMSTDIGGTATADDIEASLSYNPTNQIVTKKLTVSNASYVTERDAVTESYTNNGLNQVTSWAGSAIGYDANGNITSIGSTTYSYNNDNLLINSSGTAINYDAEKRLYNVSGVYYLYDGQDVIAELNSSGTVTGRYIHGPGIDEPLVWYVGSGTGTKRYLTSDHQGSIVNITNSSGTAYAINSYDEFGIPDSDNVGSFQFTGQVWLSSIGLYYYKARFYHAGLGRFMQTDPIGYGDGINWYAYVANDPVNLVDPWGNASCPDGDVECIRVIGKRSFSDDIKMTGLEVQRYINAIQANVDTYLKQMEQDLAALRDTLKQRWDNREQCIVSNYGPSYDIASETAQAALIPSYASVGIDFVRKTVTRVGLIRANSMSNYEPEYQDSKNNPSRAKKLKSRINTMNKIDKLSKLAGALAVGYVAGANMNCLAGITVD